MYLTLLSTRQLSKVPAAGCAFELEDLLVLDCGARLLTPTFSDDRKRLELQLNEPLQGTRAERVLMVIALNAQFLSVLQVFPRLKEEFRYVVCYIIDPWIHWSQWPLDHELTSSLDCVFVPDCRVSQQYRDVHGVPAHPLALGVDVLRFGKNCQNRPLDLVAYGRQPAQYLNALKEAFNDPRSSGFLYHDTLSDCQLGNYVDNRRLIWKFLHKSRLALCFDVLSTPESRLGVRYRSIIPLRYYEAAAAGSVIIGRHPIVPEFATQFGWHDATIDLPESPASALELIHSLLQDEQRINDIHFRNHAMAWQLHDWRYRLEDAFNLLRIPLPPQLQSQLRILQGPPKPCFDVML